ncbi:MAG: integrase core domain-containing protein [Patescibacteria group bacterium]
MYLLYGEEEGNVTVAAKKIGLSRQWLSKLKSVFEYHRKNPRSLEPEFKTPHHTHQKQRIPRETEEKIIEIRDLYGWGKESISVVLDRDYCQQASPSTVNRYLHKHLRINPKLSKRNKKAWAEKKLRESLKENQGLAVKYRPPRQIKDYLPGALMEKDMKMVPTKNKIPLIIDNKYHLQDYFNYQHTLLDSFTRIRIMELVEKPDSLNAALAYQEMRLRLPFKIAGLNTDSGGENGKDFKEQLARDEIVHFYSRISTPTDNPRVERSHLTDEKEFYNRGLNGQTFEKQKEALKNWEYTYNFLRPHQALGYLTPMKFYELWKEDPEKAYQIKNKYQAYLAKQRQRLANSRRIKKKGQIEKLMQFIDAKLKPESTLKIDLQPYKLELIKCQLCSWT